MALIKFVSPDLRGTVELNRLRAGEAFSHDGVICVKTDESGADAGEWRCMCVSGDRPGFILHLPTREKVIPVQLEIKEI